MLLSTDDRFAVPTVEKKNETWSDNSYKSVCKKSMSHYLDPGQGSVK